MKTIRKPNLFAAVLTYLVGTATVYAQSELRLYRPLTLAPAEAPAPGGAAGDQQADLAQKLQNPVADLISVPIQNNWDFGIGPSQAMKYTANIQPVVPVSISQD